jgi:spermidine synthase
LWTLLVFRHELRRVSAHVVACIATFGALLAGFALADHITTFAEDRLYQDPVVFAATSPYQRIVVTRGRAGHRLFLNGNLQFAERDEYRYHEALVHPAMAAQGAPRKVAILGGGDGMAAREVLRYPSVESITLVELDANMTRLFSTHEALTQLNGGSLLDRRLKIVNTDAFQWLQNTDEMFDVIIVDFPDPTNFSLGKLYTTSFYALMEKHLAASGYAVIQTTSPLVARESFWTVVATLEAVGLATAPYHANVPSFGEWGFVIASRRPYRVPEALPADLKFLTRESLPLLFDFPRDMARVPAEANRLSNQVLVTTYEREWGKVLP